MFFAKREFFRKGWAYELHRHVRWVYLGLTLIALVRFLFWTPPEEDSAGKNEQVSKVTQIDGLQTYTSKVEEVEPLRSAPVVRVTAISYVPVQYCPKAGELVDDVPRNIGYKSDEFFSDPRNVSALQQEAERRRNSMSERRRRQADKLGYFASTSRATASDMWRHTLVARHAYTFYVPSYVARAWNRRQVVLQPDCSMTDFAWEGNQEGNTPNFKDTLY